MKRQKHLCGLATPLSVVPDEKRARQALFDTPVGGLAWGQESIPGTDSVHTGKPVAATIQRQLISAAENFSMNSPLVSLMPQDSEESTPTLLNFQPPRGAPAARARLGLRSPFASPLGWDATSIPVQEKENYPDAYDSHLYADLEDKPSDQSCDTNCDNLFVLKRSQSYSRLADADEVGTTPLGFALELASVGPSFSTRPSPATLELPRGASGVSGVSGVSEGETPEPASPLSQHDAAEPVLQVAPLWKPRAACKTVLLVRHGESEYNARDKRSKSFTDPNIFDARLTKKGIEQCRKGRQELESRMAKLTGGKQVVLWVTSPLSRCLETFQLMCPEFDKTAALRRRTPQQRQPGEQHPPPPAPPPNMAVLQLIAEHCYTTGDVGRAPTELKLEFPSLAEHLDLLPECWWYSDGAKPNCSRTKQLGKREPLDSLKSRVQTFNRWLCARPEQVIVVFGHSTFFKHFLGGKQPVLKNCEIRTARR